MKINDWFCNPLSNEELVAVLNSYMYISEYGEIDIDLTKRCTIAAVLEKFQVPFGYAE